MHLYLMRHGKAIEPEEWDGSDRTRPLTAEGQVQVRAVATALQKKHHVKLHALLASPYVRAWQTAEIAGAVLQVEVLECAALGCGGGWSDLKKALARRAPTERILLVGHEPDLGELLGELLAGPARPFKKAGVASLSGAFKKGGMELHWQVTPKELCGAVLRA